jgi:hypothetical protein
MSSIKAFGDTYDGTAEGEYGVFTNPKNGSVFAGSHANGCARVGVHTYTNGWPTALLETAFVECNADGNPHGRILVCKADGDTRYFLKCTCTAGTMARSRCSSWCGLPGEPAKDKERAAVDANGHCYYHDDDDGRTVFEGCSADFPPFVKLKAKVLPIKARPTAAPSSHLTPPTPPPSAPSPSIGHVLALAGAGNDARRQGARLPPPPLACMGLVTHRLQKEMHRASNLDDAPAEGCTTHAARPHA